MNKKIQFNIWYVAASVFGILLLQDAWQAYRSVETVPYGQFQSYLEQGRANNVVVIANHSSGTIKDARRTEPVRDPAHR